MSAFITNKSFKRGLAVIPARCGSKRIKNKNIRDFLGRPILEYAVQAARASELFDEIVVSTDSSEISEIAEANGVKAPFVRPPDVSGDMATTAEVLVHALGWYREQGVVWDWLCCIYPTAVFVEPEQLCAAAKMLQESGATGVLTVCRFDYPIQRSVRINEQGTLEWNCPEHECTRSQDLEEAYHDAGQFYMWPAQEFSSNPRLMPSGACPFELDSRRVVDIDTEDDWALAEQTYRLLKL